MTVELIEPHMPSDIEGMKPESRYREERSPLHTADETGIVHERYGNRLLTMNEDEI